jgi:hypothetical protein
VLLSGFKFVAYSHIALILAALLPVEPAASAEKTPADSWLVLLYAGHRMIRSPQQQRVAQQDTLALPVYIIEDLVRQRLKTNITR